MAWFFGAIRPFVLNAISLEIHKEHRDFTGGEWVGMKDGLRGRGWRVEDGGWIENAAVPSAPATEE